MPSWKTLLQIIALLSIGGFALMIVSGFWLILAGLLVAVALVGLWRNRSAAKR